jgi:predicted  nucleic acid-binding Zn-ribbon protein
MKERLILLYKLNKLDRELQELNSLKGDIPAMIDELTNQKQQIEDEIRNIESQLTEVTGSEESIEKEIDSLTQRIEKDDNLLRSGAVKSNEEYNALAKEIEDAYEKIAVNEKLMEADFKGKQTDLEKKLEEKKARFDEINAELAVKQGELTELSKQNEEEENELEEQREELRSKINPEDIEFYERVSNSKYGDAIAVVRKGSCLGCFSSIPPQRAIEIRMAERFYNCQESGSNINPKK